MGELVGLNRLRIEQRLIIQCYVSLSVGVALSNNFLITSGNPKGVVLTHENVVSDVSGAYLHLASPLCPPLLASYPAFPRTHKTSLRKGWVRGYPSTLPPWTLTHQLIPLSLGVHVHLQPRRHAHQLSPSGTHDGESCPGMQCSTYDNSLTPDKFNPAKLV